jgi:hypothetical protein
MSAHFANLPEPDATAYKVARPFASATFDGIWDQEFLGAVADDVDGFHDWDGEKQFHGSRAKRWCSTWEKLPDSVASLIQYSSQPHFLKWLEELTGEQKLMPDPYLNGGGIHSIDTGGFLKMHADFNWHETLGLYRRINMLVYLNRGWQESWGGDLQLASRDAEGALTVEKSILPHFNTTVIFTTDDQSFHGHPVPITAPDGRVRNSIALYYYSVVEPAGSAAERRVNTDYRNMDGRESRSRGLLKRMKNRLMSLIAGSR